MQADATLRAALEPYLDDLKLVGIDPDIVPPPVDFQRLGLRVPRKTDRRCRTARAIMFRQFGTVCHLCGHEGANEADHIIPKALRPDLMYNWRLMRPAHGAAWGRKCPTCGQGCNQTRQASSVREARRRLAAAEPLVEAPYVPPIVLGGGEVPDLAPVPVLVASDAFVPAIALDGTDRRRSNVDLMPSRVARAGSSLQGEYDPLAHIW